MAGRRDIGSALPSAWQFGRSIVQPEPLSGQIGGYGSSRQRWEVRRQAGGDQLEDLFGAAEVAQPMLTQIPQRQLRRRWSQTSSWAARDSST